MTHLVSHHGLDFFGRSAAQKIVVKRDAHGAAKAADVGAHARGLARSVDFVNVFSRNAVRASHAENRPGDFRIIQACDLVEYGKNENGSDHRGEYHKSESNDRAPDVPCTRQPADHAKKKHDQNAAQHYANQ